MPEKEPKATAAKTFQTGMDRLVAQTMIEQEVADAFGVSKATIAKLRYDQGIPYVKISSGKPIYLVDSIMEWLKSKEVKTV